MLVEFTDENKKEKSAFLKGLEQINQIVKNIFEFAYYDNRGVVYNTDSSLHNGRCVCETNMHEVIYIPENTLLKINTRVMYECIKSGKTKITGYSTEDNQFYIFSTESNYLVGEFMPDEKLDLRQIRDIETRQVAHKNVDFLKDNFDAKAFVTLDIDGYMCMLSHKLFPSINKCETLNAYVFENNDGTFYLNLLGEVDEKNKKGETTFKMSMNYYYKFLKL